ncbi:sarcosine oxidase subunit gamma family protein [Neoaquamicrobium sediminum]|uniref:sarcosine oxidase subunit gamma family protein n=1 Tax=Neoaquamicrobium sediminum TaxID=1849104 RepID=UPI003BAA922A
MRETMRDRGLFWNPVPDWRTARIEGDGYSVRRVLDFGQTLVSGDLGAAFAELMPGVPEAGLWSVIEVGNFTVRIGRDRALLVSPASLDIAPGWREGYVVTPCDDAYAILEISGAALRGIVAEGTSVDIEAGSRSAAVLFAGVTVFLYRTGPETARLHVEAPLAAYLWAWLEGRD